MANSGYRSRRQKLREVFVAVTTAPPTLIFFYMSSISIMVETQQVFSVYCLNINGSAEF